MKTSRDGEKKKKKGEKEMERDTKKEREIRDCFLRMWLSLGC